MAEQIRSAEDDVQKEVVDDHDVAVELLGDAGDNLNDTFVEGFPDGSNIALPEHHVQFDLQDISGRQSNREVC